MFNVGPSELVVVLLIAAIYVALAVAIVAVGLRFLRRRGDPQQILRGRLARGEITPAEFEEAERIIGR